VVKNGKSGDELAARKNGNAVVDLPLPGFAAQ
jgi:hypothetical protein